MMAASSGTEGINWTDHSFTLRTDATNGTNNWVLRRIIYASNLATPAYYAVGSSGTIAKSTDGTTWTYDATVAAAMGTSDFYGIAYDSTSNILVACGDGGKYYRSTDGINWVGYTQGSQPLYSARFLNGAFWMVGSAGTILKSTTGASGTWFAQSPVAAHATYSIYDIAYGSVSGTTNKWMYAGEAGIVAYSANGTGTWLNVRSAQTTNAYNWTTNTIIFVPPSGFATTGEFLLAGSRDGTGGFPTPALYRSTTTTSLTLLTVTASTNSSQFFSVYYNAGLAASSKFIVTADFDLYTSANSTTWVKQDTYPIVSNYDLTSNPAATTVYYVGGTADNGLDPSNSITTWYGFIHTSNNSCTAYTPLVFGNVFKAVTYSSSLGKYLASSRYIVATSPDGNTWTPYFSYVGSQPLYVFAPTALGSGSNKFASGGAGYSTGSGLYVSGDGINWTLSSSITNNVFSLAYGAGGLIAVSNFSNTPDVYRSTDDGATWSALNTGISGVYQRISYTDGVGYFAVGYVTSTSNGRTKFSTNGVTWSAGANITGRLYSCAIQSGTNTYIIGSNNGNIFFSTTPASGWTTNTVSGRNITNAIGVTNKKSIVVTNDTGNIYSGKAVSGLVSRASGVTTPLYGVASSLGKVVVVGGNGTILSSP